MSSRRRAYSTEGLVLRRHNFGEADRLLTVLTPERGKLRLIAKGVRRPRSRKSGHLEPFARVRLQIARGRDLDLITQAEAVELFPQLRENLMSLGRANYVVELLDRFVVEQVENRQLYGLVLRTLERLGAGDPPQVVLRFYELRLMDFVGYRPELFNCLGCRREVQPENQFFSDRLGGILCPSCGRGGKDAKPISFSALKVMRHYQRSSYQIAMQAQVRMEVLAQVERIVEGYLTYLLERKLNSPAFLRRIRSLEAGQATSSSAR